MFLSFELLSTSELAIIWSFIAVMVVYLFSFLFVLLRSSIVSDNRILIVILAVLSVLGCLAIALKYFKKINEYVLLAMMIVYIIAYITGLLLILRKKREDEKTAEKLIAAQREKNAAKKNDDNK